MRPIKIMLCDDDAEKRHYLQLLLAGSEGFELVGVFGEGEAAVAAAPALLPDVVLMDLDLPGISGIEATRQLKAVLPAIHVVIYTVYEDDDRIFDALSAGASGYLLKKTPPAQLTEAVQEVLVGGAALSPGIAHRILGHFSCKASKSQPALDELEREILKCLAAGIPIKSIVPKVAVPEGEVKERLRRVYGKLREERG